MLDNMLQDFDYNEQQALIQLHMTPETYESIDYYRMNELLQAKSEKERAQDAFAWMRSF